MPWTGNINVCNALDRKYFIYEFYIKPGKIRWGSGGWSDDYYNKYKPAYTYAFTGDMSGRSADYKF